MVMNHWFGCVSRCDWVNYRFFASLIQFYQWEHLQSNNPTKEIGSILLLSMPEFTIQSTQPTVITTFYQSRHSNENTAVLLSANAMGWITAWSIHPRGGLLGYFKATKHVRFFLKQSKDINQFWFYIYCLQKNEMVITMETDSQNKFIITGDSGGYIRVWDIKGYCNGEDVLANKRKIDEEEVSAAS